MISIFFSVLLHSLFSFPVPPTPSYAPVQSESMDSIVVTFPEFTVTVSGTSAFEYLENPMSAEADTMYLAIEVGSSPDDKLLQITHCSLTHLVIEERTRTSLSVQGEGPHCDLTSWKHGWSPWKKLEPEGTAGWRTLTPSLSDWKIFPYVSMPEVRKAVSGECGEAWAERTFTAKSFRDSPCYVSISDYYIRIRGLRSPGNALVTRVLVLQNPMGC